MVAIFAESLTLGDFLMFSGLSLLPRNAANVQYLRGIQGSSAENTLSVNEFGIAAVEDESLTDSLSIAAPLRSQIDFNRPLKRSLSEAVVMPFGVAVKINPEANTLAEVTN